MKTVVQYKRKTVEGGADGLSGELRDLAVRHLKAGHRQETFLETIQAAADRLAASLPVKPDDKNELSNRLLVFHPRP